MCGPRNADQWDAIARVEGLFELTQGSLRLMQATPGDDMNYVVRGEASRAKMLVCTWCPSGLVLLSTLH